MENEEVLLKFEYNNCQYFIIRINDLLGCYYLKNDIRHYDLSSDEKKLIITILTKIFTFNQPLKVMDYKLNGSIYEIFIDKETNLYSFSPTPKGNDLIKLNLLFNNMEDYLAFDSNNNNKNKPFFKRIIKVGTQYIVTFVAASILVGETVTITSHFIQNSEPLYSESAIIAMAKASKLSDQEIINSIKQAVMNNHFLTDQEESKILSNLSLFVDNKDNMDLDFIISALGKIRIKYKSSPSKDEGVMGCYNYRTNEIIFYEADDLDSVEDFVFTHEMLHAMQKVSSSSHNTFLIETTNTIFNNEYCNTTEESVYNNYLGYTKALMEIIDPNILKTYHNFPSDKIVIDALCCVVDDEDEARQLLSYLNSFKKVFKEGILNPEDEDLKNNLIALEMKIKESLSMYYQAKYGTSIDNDLLMLYYTDRNAFHDALKIYLEATDLIMSVDEDKYYFNSTHENKRILTVHTLTNLGKTKGEILITEDTRYINNSLNNSPVK